MTENEFISLFKSALQKANIHISSERIIQGIAKSFVLQFNEEVIRNQPLFNSSVIGTFQRIYQESRIDHEKIISYLRLLMEHFGIPADKFPPERVIWPPRWLGWEEEKPDLWEYYREEQEKFISRKLPFVVLLKFKKPLDSQDLICQKQGKFESIEDLRYRRDSIVKLLKTLGRRLFNTPCARLHSYKYCEKTKRLELKFQSVDYFDSLYTNQYCDLLYKNWQRRTRGILALGPSLPSLEESKCGNHLGVNLILEIRDDFIVLQNRSYLEAVYPNRLAPSVSGAMEYKFDTPFDAIRDEANLELGLLQEEIKDIKLVGLGRDLDRAGKPEAFFIGKSDVSREKLEEYFVEKRGQEYWELYEEGPFRFIHKTEEQKIREKISDTNEPVVTRAALWFWLESITS